MDFKKNTKISKNNENENPSPSKRFKHSTKHLKLIDEEDSNIFEEMGVGMLESDESSSPGTSSITAVNNTLSHISYTNDKNLNECSSTTIEAESFEQDQCHITEVNSQYENDVNHDVGDDDEEASNIANFIDPNETLIPSSTNYKTSNTNVEIYLDNSKTSERIHKKVSNCSYTKGRSPLALVACNNNYNNINQNGNTIDSTTKKQTYVPNESFFLFRNRSQKSNYGKDPFKKLSDEIILQIFKWLPKKALIRCSYVSRKFNQLACDESLWTRLDLGGKTLRSGALGKVVSRGVVILRLAQAELSHPVFDPDSIESLPEYQSKLQYLDLSMAVITKPSLKMLLNKCRQLKKLSLEHVKINDEICNEIAKNKNLEALNVAMSEGIESWSIQNMLSELKKLHSLNISWTLLKVESVKALVDHITPDLLRLNIAGCRKAMFDSHLETLSKRCPNLLELDLSDCTALTSSAIDLICKFKDLEYLSLSRCYSISASSYIKLEKLTSLSYLDVFGLLSDAALSALQESFPTVGINKFIYSSVARPTVGTRRTSIWGLRTRD